MIDSQAASQARDLVCCPALVSLVLALHNTYLLSAKASPLDPAEEYAVVTAVLAGCALLRGGVIVRAALIGRHILSLGPIFIIYTL